MVFPVFFLIVGITFLIILLVGGVSPTTAQSLEYKNAIEPSPIGMILNKGDASKDFSNIVGILNQTFYEPVGEIHNPPLTKVTMRTIEEKSDFAYLPTRDGMFQTYDVSSLLNQQFTTHELSTSSQRLVDGHGLVRNSDYIYDSGYRGIEAENVRYSIFSDRSETGKAKHRYHGDYFGAFDMREQNLPTQFFYEYSSDVSINVEVAGVGDKSLVFLHGFGTTLRVWDDVRKMFPKDQYQMFFLDLKGFGNSSKPRHGDYSLHEQARIIISFIEAYEIDNYALIGHSYGGGVALLTQITLMNSDQQANVDELVLIDCLCYKQAWPSSALALRVPILNTVLMNYVPAQLQAKYVLDLTYYDPKKITREKIDLYTDAYSVPGVERSFIQVLEQIEPKNYSKVTRYYRNIAIPTLIIWGKNDQLIPVDHGIRLHSEISNSTLSIIEQCGHVPHEEHPRKTYDSIRRFLQGN